MAIPKFLVLLLTQTVDASTIQWEWDACDGENMVVAATTVPLTPKLGKGFSADVKLKMPADVEAGKIHITGKYSLGTFSQTIDLCKTAVDVQLPMHLGRVSTTGFQCPKSKGDEVEIKVSAEVSNALRFASPSGSMKAVVTNKDGTEIGCATAKYKVHGWIENKPEHLTEVYI